MSSGMNTEQAKEYAKTMTYRQAISNVGSGKFIKYRKATMIKLRELAEIADRLDCKTEPTCDDCIWNVCNYNKVPWDEGDEPTGDNLSAVEDEPQIKLCRECDDYAGDGMFCASNYMVFDFSKSIYKCESKPQTDCAWGRDECK